MIDSFVRPELLHATIEYSNALLIAVLPLVSDCCQKLNIPIATPIKAQQVRSFACPVSERNLDNCCLVLTNWCSFTFHQGMMDTFADARNGILHIDDNRERSRHYGSFKMTRDQAVVMAREALARMGFSLEDIFADCEPTVTIPHWDMDGTNVLPFYEIEWADPREPVFPGDTRPAASVEVDAQRQRITDWEVGCSTAWKDSLLVPPESIKRMTEEVRDPNIAAKPILWINTNVLLSILARFPECEKMLGIPIAWPPRVNETKFTKEDDIYDIRVRGGYDFGVVSGVLRGYIAPDSFYRRTLRAPVRRYWGDWNMSENEAIEMARQFLDKLHYWSHPCIYDRRPVVKKPRKAGSHTIARYEVEWENELPPREGPLGRYIPVTEWAGVEIDASARCVKSFSVYCPAVMGHVSTSSDGRTQP